MELVWSIRAFCWIVVVVTEYNWIPAFLGITLNYYVTTTGSTIPLFVLSWGLWLAASNCLGVRVKDIRIDKCAKSGNYTRPTLDGATVRWVELFETKMCVLPWPWLLNSKNSAEVWDAFQSKWMNAEFNRSSWNAEQCTEQSWTPLHYLGLFWSLTLARNGIFIANIDIRSAYHGQVHFPFQVATKWGQEFQLIYPPDPIDDM